jgi:hypothetical protein
MVRALQPTKALSPIAVTDEEMFTEVRPTQPEKALEPIAVTT